jgi:hypothetical protein
MKKITNEMLLNRFLKKINNQLDDVMWKNVSSEIDNYLYIKLDEPLNILDDLHTSGIQYTYQE